VSVPIGPPCIKGFGDSWRLLLAPKDRTQIEFVRLLIKASDYIRPHQSLAYLTRSNSFASGNVPTERQSLTNLLDEYTPVPLARYYGSLRRFVCALHVCNRRLTRNCAKERASEALM
jgi:hypothetical protein